MDRVAVICKLAMKWYLMRMYANWLCPFNYRQTLAQSSSVVTNNLRNALISKDIEYKYTLQHISRESASYIVRISESV